jgi:cytochrome P450
MMRPSEISRGLILRYSELNPELRADPHKLLDEQRAERPAERDAAIPGVVITAYKVARSMLQDPELSRNFDDAAPQNPFTASVRWLSNALEGEFGKHSSMLTLDGEAHRRVRGVVAEAFLKRAAQALPLVARVVEAALDRLEGRERFDIVADYAGYVPTRILGAMLGVAEADMSQLAAWTVTGQEAFNPATSQNWLAEAIAARTGVLSYFRAMLAARRADPRDDLCSDLLAAQAAGAPISDREIYHNLFALLAAGHLTTADLIGNGVLLLLERPAARKAMLDDPSRVAAVIEEILRFDPPITYTARFARADGVTGGCPYAKGDALGASLLAANHDPDVFDHPHDFDPERARNPHMAFGAGAHICVGAPLARIEGQVAILRLFQRFPNLARADDGPPLWRAVPGVRGLESLEVRTA